MRQVHGQMPLSRHHPSRWGRPHENSSSIITHQNQEMSFITRWREGCCLKCSAIPVSRNVQSERRGKAAALLYISPTTCRIRQAVVADQLPQAHELRRGGCDAEGAAKGVGQIGAERGEGEESRGEHREEVA